jgi:capsular polysaccharide biosynthesis protein
MNTQLMLKLAKNNLKTALLFGLFLGALSFLVLVTTQKSFKSSLDLLVVQSQTGTVDYYTLSRSADYLTNVITESVYSEKFLDEVKATGKITAPFLIGDNAQKLKDWQKVISVKKNSSVGILNIKIFANTQSQAAEISDAVTDVLINKNDLFLGKGQNLEIRILSGPIIEKNPSLSQIASSVVGGLVMGILFYLLFVIYREEYFRKDEMILFDNNSEIVPERESQEIENQDYLSEDSEYWKKKLESLS